jgi:hypothetical protein
MRTPRERAEELARKLFFDIFYSDKKVSIIIDTLTPLLEEIDAARKMRDAKECLCNITESMCPFCVALHDYESIRKRNEALSTSEK